MKILGLLRNKSKKEDIIETKNGLEIGIKDFLVTKAIHSICKIEKATGTLITNDKLISINKKDFLKSFDKLICFGNTQSVLKEFYRNNSHKFIFLEGSLYERDPYKSMKEHKYFRVMQHNLLGNNFIKKYSNNTIREGFDFISKSVDINDHVLLINNDMTGENSIDQMRPFAWLEDTLNKVVKKTNRKIVIRLHPNQSKISNESVEKINRQVKQMIVLSNNKYIEEDIKRASVAIMYSSGSCVECLLHGVPVISTDPSSYCYELFSKKLEDIDNIDDIIFPDIDNFLSAISNTHFTLEEIISGKFWKIQKNFIND